MDRTRLSALIGLLVIALQSSFPQLARAEEPPQPHLANIGGSVQPRFALALRYSDDLVLGTEGTHAVQRVEISAPPIPRECKPKYMVGPGLGVPLGVGTVMGGAVMVAVGNLDVLNTGDAKTRRDRALIAGGSIMIGAGLAAFIYSSVKLSQNRHARRRVCDSDTPQSSRAIDASTGPSRGRGLPNGVELSATSPSPRTHKGPLSRPRPRKYL